MLEWLGRLASKPDHPLADEKSVRVLISELPSTDSVKALEELSYWFDSLAAADGFKLDARLGAALLLDEAAQTHLRKLSREYLGAARLPKFQENRLWGLLTGFWQQAQAAYGRCLDDFGGGARGAGAAKGMLALGVVRAMRAASQEMKWKLARYGPVDPVLWERMVRGYRLAEEHRVAEEVVTVYPGIPGASSPAQELIKPCVIWESAPGALVPLQLELAERIVAHCGEMFRLAREPFEGARWMIDFGEPGAPLRLTGAPPQGEGLRFVGMGTAGEELDRLIRCVQAGDVPAEVNLGGAYPPGQVLDVLQHLHVYWGEQPPSRRHQRTRVVVRLDVVHGYDGVVAALSGLEGSSLVQPEIESWVAEDVSAGGFGAQITAPVPDWLQVGGLIGMKPEGVPHWGVAVVRRMSRDSTGAVRAGVETLASSASVVMVAPDVQTGSPHHAEVETEVAIRLGNGEAGAQTPFLMRGGSYAGARPFRMHLHGRRYLLLPAALAEQGQDYDCALFRVMEQDTSE